MTNGKTIALSRRTYVGKVMSLLFNMLFRFVSAFLPRSKLLLLLCFFFYFTAEVTISSDFRPPKIKSVTVSIVSPSICPEVMELDAMILVFRMLSFKPTFSLFSFTFIKRLFTQCVIYSPSSRLEAMAPHSSPLAWKIPWMEEPGRLQSMG